MIDVQGIFFNSLWILALAILLALLSWTSWKAEHEGVRFRVVWARPGLRRLVTLSLVLFCAGMAAVSGRWWERLLWLVLALLQLLPLFLAWLSSRNSTKNDTPHG